MIKKKTIFIYNFILSGLVLLAYSTDEECSYHAALSFRKLAPNLKSHPIIVYAGGFKALFHLMHSGTFLMIFICNFHVLSDLLLIYICKLHWNLNTMFVCQVNYL